jgi:hypothetical protein
MSANAAAALAYRAREKLRQAYLQAHLQAAPRPECEPHRSRLGAYVRDGLSRRDRGTTEGHLDDCGSCRSLVGELADVNRMLVRSLLPIFTATGGTEIGVVAATAAGAGGGAAGFLGARLVSKVKSNPAVVAGVVLAAALAFALVSSRTDETALPPGESDPSAGDKSNDEPGPPPDVPVEVPPGEEPPRVIVPIMAVAPTTTTTTSPDSPRRPPPSPTTSRPPSIVPPPPIAPTTTTTRPAPPTTRPPKDSPYLVVIWLDATAELRITLHNPTEQTTSPLALEVQLSAGAKIRGRPAGCGLLTTLLTRSSCGLSPVGPGGAKSITVGVDITGSSPKATIGVCEASLLSLNCNGGLLASLVTTLI